MTITIAQLTNLTNIYLQMSQMSVKQTVYFLSLSIIIRKMASKIDASVFIERN
jgi:hypothetical protein